jgi:transcriptional regulator with XRE-family HTH domain
LQGKTQYEIAERLGVSQPTICRDLRAIRKLWIKESIKDFGEMRARELAEIDHLERTYWEAWERSLGHVSAGQKLGIIRSTMHYLGEGEDEGEGPATKKVTVREDEVVGDLGALQGVQWCIDRRIKLLGLDSPELLTLVDENFDQEKWAAERENRIAGAIQRLQEGGKDDPAAQSES